MKTIKNIILHIKNKFNKKFYKVISVVTAVSCFMAVFCCPLGVSAKTKMSPTSAITMKGADISHIWSVYSWPTVKQNLDFVIIKSSEGTSFNDPKLYSNINGAKSVGLHFGTYHYFLPDKSGIVQSNIYWNRIKGTGYDINPSVDVEETRGKSWDTITAELKAFCINFKNLSGIYPMIYISPAFADKYLIDPFFSQMKLWIAEYGVSAPVTTKYWSKYQMWQTGYKDVIGIDNKADYDIATNDILINSAQSNVIVGDNNFNPNFHYGDNGVYSVKSSQIGIPENATLNANFRVFNSDGTYTNHVFTSGSKIRIANETQDSRFLEVFCNINSEYLLHGYIVIDMNNINVDQHYTWKNGKTPEPAYNITTNKYIGNFGAGTICDYYYKFPNGDYTVGRQTTHEGYKIYKVAYHGGLKF